MKRTDWLFLCLLALVACNKGKPKILATWVIIPEGNYQLGKQKHWINPSHIAHIHSFTISRYEVTNSEFDSFTKATNYVTLAERRHDALVYKDSLGEFTWFTDSTANWRFPQGIKNCSIEDKMNHPVTCISFVDAMAYCKWKNVRLPTLDEWEVACRAGSKDDHFFGNDFSLIKDYANCWYKKNHLSKDTSDPWVFTSPVGSLRPNQWGLYDVYGNVFELCSNIPPTFKANSNIASARGGSWWCSRYSCNYVNSVDIGRVSKFASFANLGFRVVKK